MIHGSLSVVKPCAVISKEIRYRKISNELVTWSGAQSSERRQIAELVGLRLGLVRVRVKIWIELLSQLGFGLGFGLGLRLDLGNPQSSSARPILLVKIYS